MRHAALSACSSCRGHAAAPQRRRAAATTWPQRQQQRPGRVRVLSNTEQLQDSWSPQARAAVLGLKLEAWDALLPVAPALATCEPSGGGGWRSRGMRTSMCACAHCQGCSAASAHCASAGLFVLKEVAGLLQLSVADVVALAAEVPALLRTPALQVEAHIGVSAAAAAAT